MKLEIKYKFQTRGSRQVSTGFYSRLTNYEYWVEAEATDKETKQEYSGCSFTQDYYPTLPEIGRMKAEAKESLIDKIEADRKARRATNAIEEILSPEEIEI